MNSTESTLVESTQTIASTLLAPNSAFTLQQDLPVAGANAVKLGPRVYGYGLPCLKCKTYYAANLTSCPVCKSTERVSPTIQAITVPSPAAEQTPDPEILEQERERFLQEFKAQIQPGELEINATTSFRCSKEENHEGSFEPAAVCQGCYDHLQERADQFEAALHIDVKTATQIIYEAVWSDPSDPSKTYQNAAQALLNELHKRAGISSILGSLQPLQH